MIQPTSLAARICVRGFEERRCVIVHVLLLLPGRQLPSVHLHFVQQNRCDDTPFGQHVARRHFAPQKLLARSFRQGENQWVLRAAHNPPCEMKLDDIPLFPQTFHDYGTTTDRVTPLFLFPIPYFSLFAINWGGRDCNQDAENNYAPTISVPGALLLRTSAQQHRIFLLDPTWCVAIGWS